ncbi:MAG: ribosome silencing factor [Acidobacteriota bacterium]
MTQIVRVAVEAVTAKQAEEVVVLDVSQVCSFAQNLMICHGRSSRQVKTLTSAVLEAGRNLGRHPHHLEGERTGEWVLMDYLDLVVHIFCPRERREFFALERLWGDAPRRDLGDILGQGAGGSGSSRTAK